MANIKWDHDPYFLHKRGISWNESCFNGFLDNPMEHVRSLVRMIPRYSIFQFRKLSNTFSFHGVFIKENITDIRDFDPFNRDLKFLYWEGPVNYGLILMGIMVLSLFLLFLFVCYKRSCGLKYSIVTVSVIRVIIFVIGFAILILNLLVVSGHVLTCACVLNLDEDVFQHFRRNLTSFVIMFGEAMSYMHDYLYGVNAKAQFVKVHKEGEIQDVIYDDESYEDWVLTTTTTTPKPTNKRGYEITLSIGELILQETLKSQSALERSINFGWTSIAQAVKQVTTTITSQMKQMAKAAIEMLKNQIMGPFKDLEKPAKRAVKNSLYMLNLSKETSKLLLSICIAGLSFFILSLLVSICIIRSACSGDNNRMKWQVRVCCGLMVGWWITSAIGFPMILFISDWCDDPKQATVEMAVEVVTYFSSNMMSESLVTNYANHFTSCKGVNPLLTQAGDILKGLGLVGRALSKLLSNATSYGYVSNAILPEGGSKALRYFASMQGKVYGMILWGCEYTTEYFENIVDLLCNQCFLGALIVGILAPILALLFFVFLIFCLRVEHFMEGRPIHELDESSMSPTRNRKIVEYRARVLEDKLERTRIIKKLIRKRDKKAKKLSYLGYEKPKRKIPLTEIDPLKNKKDPLKKFGLLTERERRRHNEFEYLNKKQLKKFAAILKHDVSEQKQLAKKLKATPVCLCPPVSPLEDMDEIEKQRALLRQMPECPKTCKGKVQVEPGAAPVCKGMERIRLFMKYGTDAQTRDDSDEAVVTNCPEALCRSSQDAIDQLYTAIHKLETAPIYNTQHETVRLECGCKYPLNVLKHWWGWFKH